MKVKFKETKNKKSHNKVSIPQKVDFEAIKRLGPEISMASKVLRGITIKGRVVEKVFKGKGPWRYLIFKDKTYLAIKRETLLTLLSGICEKKCLEIFRKQNEAGKLYIAMKCLLYRSKHGLSLSKVPGADLEVIKSREQELSKKRGIRDIKKIRTPSCELCNLHFAYYFSGKALLNKFSCL